MLTYKRVDISEQKPSGFFIICNACKKEISEALMERSGWSSVGSYSMSDDNSRKDYCSDCTNIKEIIE